MNELEIANQDEEISKGMDYKWMWEQLRGHIENEYYENEMWAEETRNQTRRLLSEPLPSAALIQNRVDDLKIAQKQMATYDRIDRKMIDLEREAKINAKKCLEEENGK